MCINYWLGINSCTSGNDLMQQCKTVVGDLIDEHMHSIGHCTVLTRAPFHCLALVPFARLLGWNSDTLQLVSNWLVFGLGLFTGFVAWFQKSFVPFWNSCIACAIILLPIVCDGGHMYRAKVGHIPRPLPFFCSSLRPGDLTDIPVLLNTPHLCCILAHLC